MVGGNQLGACGGEFADGLRTGGGIQVFDRIPDDRNATPSTKQPSCSATDTIFRNDTENKKLRIEREIFKNLLGVGIIKDIQRLLFDENLLVVQQIRWAV